MHCTMVLVLDATSVIGAQVRSNFCYLVRFKEAAKNSFLVAPRGGRGKGRATKKKTSFKARKKIPKKNLATKLEGGGKALMAGPLKKDHYFFCSFPYLSGIITVHVVSDPR